MFPADDSLLKMLYLAMMDITKKWTGRRQGWSLIHAQMAIYLQIFSRRAFSSGVRFFLAIYKTSCMVLCGASILHHAGGLHKVWDSFPRTSSHCPRRRCP